ncbi:MAG: DUF3048 C-terminal domain-containing protein [Clostridia bacterium]|nr:DUF3048 C-terminal domain-containing protein [Clostridia bacterium]
MKKVISLVLALILLLSCMPASLAGGIETVIVDEEDRKLVKANQTFPSNIAVPGESPTTGLPWDGVYLPMLVQIDNSNGGVDAKHQPWGARYADVVYESPLHRLGATRISYLFSDYIPDSVGPVRSARVGHVWLWYEWRGGFLFYGGQEAYGSNINTELKELGYRVAEGAPLFSGIVSKSKPWKKFYTRKKGRPSPSNVDANVAAMQALFPADYVAPSRPFLFTDELPDTGDFAYNITVKWKHKNYVTSFTYDEMSNTYLRFVTGEPYVDSETGEQISFSNIIIQRTNLRFNGGNDKPITDNVGSGNCEIFMGGRYIPGYWVRSSMEDRTIYFDADGNELELQRGKTYIAMPDYDIPVTYSAQ